MTNRKMKYWVIPPKADAEFTAAAEQHQSHVAVHDHLGAVFLLTALVFPTRNALGCILFGDLGGDTRIRP